MNSDNMQKKCGFCGETIPARAGRCPYCGSILEVTFDDSFRLDVPETRPEGGETGQDAEQQSGQIENGAQQGAEQQENPESAGMTPPAANPGYRPMNAPQAPNAYKPYGNGGYTPGYNYGGIREPLSNGMKVFLATLFAVVPGIGQLAGIIAAIVFMNSEGDSDRKSFGVALLVASLIMFVISCIGCFVFILAFSNQFNY